MFLSISHLHSGPSRPALLACWRRTRTANQRESERQKIPCLECGPDLLRCSIPDLSVRRALPPDQPSAPLFCFCEEQLIGGHVRCHFSYVPLIFSKTYLCSRHTNLRRCSPLEQPIRRHGIYSVNSNHRPLPQVLPENVKIGMYKKDSDAYKGLTYRLTSWAEGHSLSSLSACLRTTFLPWLLIARLGCRGSRDIIHCGRGDNRL